MAIRRNDTAKPPCNNGSFAAASWKQILSHISSVEYGLLDRILRTVAEHAQITPGDAVGIAVSGGADSVCLLHALADLRTALGIARLHVLHLNHGLRGAESDADADFVARLAKSMNLDCVVELANLHDAGGTNLEQNAREARIDFFRRAMADSGLQRIATAHTRDDQAETVLYRLMRGSGTAGLSGIRPVTRDGRIRPLLDCSRAEVEEFLRSRGLSWREDQSNADRRFARNRIRHELLPLLERDYSPAIREILAATAMVARDEEAWWEERTEEVFALTGRKKLTSVLFRTDELTRHPVALVRRLLRRAFAEVKGDLRSIDLAHVERVRALIDQTEGHGRVQIPGLDIMRSFEWLRVAAPRVETRLQGDYCFTVDLTLRETARFPMASTGGCMLLETRALVHTLPEGAYNENVDELDLAKLPPGLVELRNWHPGDEIELPGRPSVKIKQLFQQHRIPLWDRHTWPVLESGGTIVWSREFGVSAQVARTDSTRSVLRVREQGRTE